MVIGRVRAINAYMARLHVAAATDPVVGRTFLQVANLVTRPEKLLAPTMALRVLRGSRRAATGVSTPDPWRRHDDGDRSGRDPTAVMRLDARPIDACHGADNPRNRRTPQRRPVPSRRTGGS